MIGFATVCVSSWRELMSALGQKQTCAVQKVMSALPPKADMCGALARCPLCAKSGLLHRSKQHRYSITSSAAISKPGGTVKPSAFAVLRLMTVSNFVGVCTGRSAAFAPRRMLST